MLDKIKNLFKKPELPKVEVKEPEVLVTPKVKKPRKPKEKKVQPVVKELSPKEKATAAGEPYVNILSMEIDPNNINATFVLTFVLVCTAQSKRSFTAFCECCP